MVLYSMCWINALNQALIRILHCQSPERLYDGQTGRLHVEFMWPTQAKNGRDFLPNAAFFDLVETLRCN